MSKNQLPDGTIKNLQQYIASKIEERGFADESVHERLLLLAEEVGELIKAARHISGMNVNQAKEKSSEIGEEVTDVINLVFAVAIKLGLDVEEEFRKKEAIIDERMYKRSNNQT